MFHDPDDIAGDIARQVAAIHEHLPATHPLCSPAITTPVRIVVYTDGGVDRAAIAVPAWDQLYALADTTTGATIVVVTEDAEDGSRRVVDAYQDGLPYRPPPELANLPSDEVARHQVDAQLDALVGHLPPAALLPRVEYIGLRRSLWLIYAGRRTEEPESAPASLAPQRRPRSRRCEKGVDRRRRTKTGPNYRRFSPSAHSAETRTASHLTSRMSRTRWFVEFATG